MDVLFNIGAERIFGLPRADNFRAVRCYREQGFTEEGRIRAHYPHPDGHLEDAIVFGMMKHEWNDTMSHTLPARLNIKQ